MAEITETHREARLELSQPVGVDHAGETYLITKARYATAATADSGSWELITLLGHRVRRDGKLGVREVCAWWADEHTELWDLLDGLVAQARAALDIQPAAISRPYDWRWPRGNSRG